MIQAHIFYSGTVQGVGFRYTVRGCAAEFNLKGWVRNTRDGRVELRVEGLKRTIEEFCASVEKHFEGLVKDKEVFVNKSLENFKDFRVIG